ncbi:MAG TPA: hypothetical protein VLJ86_01400 [Ramlibacter sp.]|nr:hypothetical protein [Ramlibacter sp.]
MERASAQAGAEATPLAVLLSSLAGHTVVVDAVLLSGERRSAVVQAMRALEPSLQFFMDTQALDEDLVDMLLEFEREQPPMGFKEYALKTLLKNCISDTAQDVGRDAASQSEQMVRAPTLLNATWAVLEATVNLVNADIDQTSFPDLQAQLQMGLADGYAGLLRAAARPPA